jgi:hypothetical protein
MMYIKKREGGGKVKREVEDYDKWIVVECTICKGMRCEGQEASECPIALTEMLIFLKDRRFNHEEDLPYIKTSGGKVIPRAGRIRVTKETRNTKTT